MKVFKLRLGASTSRFVCLSLCLSVLQTTSRFPNKLFGNSGAGLHLIFQTAHLIDLDRNLDDGSPTPEFPNKLLWKIRSDRYTEKYSLNNRGPVADLLRS